MRIPTTPMPQNDSSNYCRHIYNILYHCKNKSKNLLAINYLKQKKNKQNKKSA